MKGRTKPTVVAQFEAADGKVTDISIPAAAVEKTLTIEGALAKTR